MPSSQENFDEENLHLVYKKLGETPLEALQNFKKENPEVLPPLTYAGRLDPMAEGLLIILSGEKVNEKDKYLDLEKTYEFEVLWGASTDTEDLLGKIEDTKNEYPDQETVKDYINKAVGKFEQKYPAFSSKPVNGKPLFVWAREGKLNEIEIPSHVVEVFAAEYLERREISNADLLPDIKKRIGLVSGDFRQKEVLENWDSYLVPSNTKYVLDKISLKVSSGFYIRQFVHDLTKNFDAFGTTFHIKRIKIGDYAIAE